MGTVPFLDQAVVVLAAAVAVALLSARLRIPPVVGFLISGMLIGPSGLALITDMHQVEIFAEIGVVLLLFVIGLQLNTSEMRHLGRAFLVGGSLQWVLTTALTVAALIGFGVQPANALFIGFVVSLSSTAVVLQEYQQRRETGTPQGRAVLGVLLFQDLLIVPMIALAPVLSGSIETSISTFALRFGGAMAVVAIVFFLGREVTARLFRIVAGARVREVFVLWALTTCLAMSWFTARLDFSLALGAFLAGLLVAETEYSHQVIADIGPFRDLFASIFFVSIGMLVDLPFALTTLPLLVGVAILLALGKAVAAGFALRAAGFPLRIAAICGIGLAQIGEFSFVLMEVGRANGLLEGDRFQILLTAAVITVALTPFLIRVAPAIGGAIASMTGERSSGEALAQHDMSGHVVVIGYGLNGSLLARVLGAAHIPHLVVELNPDAARRARGEGVEVLFGDALRKGILQQAGVERARVVVFAMSDPIGVVQSVKATRELAPNVEIIVRTRQFVEIESVRKAGADHIVAEEFETAIEIFTRVLNTYHVPRNVIQAETQVLRGEAYRMLRSEPFGQALDTVLQALEGGTAAIYRVLADGPTVGRSLRDMDLRQQTGVSVLVLVRGERSHPNPSPDLVLEPGDSLVLMGSHAQMEDAFRFLDRGFSV